MQFHNSFYAELHEEGTGDNPSVGQLFLNHGEAVRNLYMKVRTMCILLPTDRRPFLVPELYIFLCRLPLPAKLSVRSPQQSLRARYVSKLIFKSCSLRL